MEAARWLLCAKTEEKVEGSGGPARSRDAEDEGGALTCAQQGRWGLSAGKGAEAAAGRKRTGEWGGTRGPRVENVGRPGKKENGSGPREIV
jgi:hypothetical protein